MKPDLAVAESLIANVQLLSIRLIKAECSAEPELEKLPDEDLGIALRFHAKPTGEVCEQQFRVYSSIETGLFPGGDPEQEPVLFLAFTFELCYSVPQDFAPSKEELEAFARVNGVFNSWPYLRECVQSTAQRMGYPGFLLPVYRVSQPPQPDPDKVVGGEE